MSKQKAIKRYIDFCTSHAAAKVTGRTEGHHIFPRKICPQWISHPKNLVHLTRKDHLYAHYLLLQAEPHNLKVIFAFNMMTGRRSLKAYNYSEKKLQNMAKAYEQTKAKLIPVRSAWMKSVRARPEVQKKNHILLIKRNSDPEFQKRRSAQLASMHADPEVQKKRLVQTAKYNSSLAAREHLVKLAKINADPRKQQKRLAHLSQLNASQKHQAHLSEMNHVRWHVIRKVKNPKCVFCNNEVL